MYSRYRRSTPSYNRIDYRRGRERRYNSRPSTDNWFKRFAERCSCLPEDSDKQTIGGTEHIDLIEEELTSAIKVKNIELNIQENTKKHHTSKYDCTREDRKERGEEDGKKIPAELVVRRGDEFTLTVTFDKPYDRENDNLSFIFKTGEFPLPKSRTHSTCKLSGEKTYKPGEWGVRIIKTGDETEEGKSPSVTFGIFIPANCVIGEWKFVIKTIIDVEDGKQKSVRYDHPDPIKVLLNPWCKEDTVYLPTEKLLDEYILNDGGAIYYGNYRQIGSRGWNFAQFSDGILDVALFILQKSFGFKVDGNMGDPVYIARAFSRIVNNNDDAGVLVGNWSGDYKDGTRPTAWVGSYKILMEYMEKGEPVKFGQCWVFSGVLTTVCRAVGLPCRSVTNFMSAHDTDMSCTIDKIFAIDEEGDLSECEGYGDSTWNFHVWNEVWMKRPDLDYGYDGWQVIDATPQETSDGVYCLGPSPVTAVKKGEINTGFDTAFVFAEVNADCIDWLREDYDDLYVLGVNKTRVGKKISTKKATGLGYNGRLSIFGDDPDREDLTLSYKYLEGSTEERETVNKVHKTASSNKVPHLDKSTIELILEDKDGIMVGNDFNYSVIIKNTSDKTRSVKVSLSVLQIEYDGDIIGKVASKHFDEQEIESRSEAKLTIDVLSEEYLAVSANHFSFKVIAFCIVKEERTAHVEYDDFRLRRPDITIEAPEECKENDILEVTAYFENPLNRALTKCSLQVEGSLQLCSDKQKKNIKFPDVPPKSKWETKLKVKPKKRDNDERDLFLSFDCEEIPDIVGYHTLFIV
ncbi:hypothetical protein LOTGIDRAFT_188829 [Lottia gigantea]|uniref:Transglutaminase-like domain-containing protein n=1 Tax=Lottia gigantea TaxID=225164 RepID=V4AN19_LOTGI|nr:hypothetical protein LOTGIDRAFT_188829 [Lottia gigantea]ESO95006.1 hypothetical protein LOTGIDRAFT_188829 [Lottia gigantea]